MIDHVTAICAASDKDAAVALAIANGDGPGAFSVPLSTQQNVSDPAQATHWGMTGYLATGEGDALNVSLNPMVKLFPLDDGSTFDQHLAMCQPPLYRLAPPPSNY